MFKFCLSLLLFLTVILTEVPFSISHAQVITGKTASLVLEQTEGMHLSDSDDDSSGETEEPEDDPESKNEHPLLQTGTKSVTIKEATDLFKEFQENKTIPWDYCSTGCNARAHVVCDTLRSRDIATGKVWVIGDDLNIIPVKYKNIHWNYHVAPIIYVEGIPGHSQPVPLVIDPSLAKTPISITVWDELMTHEKDTHYESAFITPWYLFDPADVRWWQLSSEYIPDLDDLEDSVGEAQAMNEINVKELKKGLKVVVESPLKALLGIGFTPQEGKGPKR